uniref:Vitamin K-dependent protein C n=1 Tax=Xiphophorus couchianus TaxID=32473 RepID=A0A3B5MLX9_9TELE
MFYRSSALCSSPGIYFLFSDPPSAHMLLRSRRANSFLEELKPPSKERECVEEKCDFEEAREIFQTREATVNGNQCQSHMCVHGDCVDQHQDYKCLCYHGYEGRYCQYNVTASNCSVDNGDCDHECSESDGGARRSCSCLNGYKLDDDSRKCSPKSTSSCGQILIDRSEYSEPVDGLLPWTLGGEVGKKGENPWQVLVLNARGQFHCGGVLIDENWVLTAAHCLENNFRFSVRLGELSVCRSINHQTEHNTKQRENDTEVFVKLLFHLILITEQQKVLHLNGTTTVVTGWGKDDSGKYSSALNVIKVPLVNHTFCSQQMFPHEITNNVLCAGILGQKIDACEGDSGGPMVTLYRGTWFLVGLVSWGERCGMVDKLGIYTKVSNYNEWITQVQEEWDRGVHPQ